MVIIACYYKWLCTLLFLGHNSKEDTPCAEWGISDPGYAFYSPDTSLSTEFAQVAGIRGHHCQWQETGIGKDTVQGVQLLFNYSWPRKYLSLRVNTTDFLCLILWNFRQLMMVDASRLCGLTG